MSDLRNNTRIRSLKAGRIFFNEGRSTLDCTIRNISETGAKLSFVLVPGLPERFILILADRSRKQCTVRWRKSMEIGVSFDAAPDGGGATSIPALVPGS